jgi:hypothetical protein
MGHDTLLFVEAVLGEVAALCRPTDSPKRFSTRRSISRVTVPSLYVEKLLSVTGLADSRKISAFERANARNSAVEPKTRFTVPAAPAEAS